MNVTRTFFTLGWLFTLSLCTHAWAEGGPPVIGDDPGTPGAGHWEINVAYISLRTPGHVTMELPHLDLNYGVGDHLQLKYEVGLMIGKNENQPWMTGVNNSLFGVKWRFLDEEKNGVDMSIYPQFGINTSHELGRAGLVDNGNSLFLPVEIAKSFGKLELDFEAGFQYSQYAPNQYIAGVIVGYRLTERIELLAEARGVVDDHLRCTDLILDGGARLSINEHLALMFAAGRSLRSGDDNTQLYVYAGLRFTF